MELFGTQHAKQAVSQPTQGQPGREDKNLSFPHLSALSGGGGLGLGGGLNDGLGSGLSLSLALGGGGSLGGGLNLGLDLGGRRTRAWGYKSWLAATPVDAQGAAAAGGVCACGWLSRLQQRAQNMLCCWESSVSC